MISIFHGEISNYLNCFLHTLMISWWSRSNRRCSVKKVFIKISKNWQENTCVTVSFLNKVAGWGTGVSCEFCKISKNTFSYRAPPVAACDDLKPKHIRILSSNTHETVESQREDIYKSMILGQLSSFPNIWNFWEIRNRF